MTRRECSECGRFHAVPDIGGTGWLAWQTVEPKPRLPLWKRILCNVWHLWEERRECPYKDGHYEGIVKPGRLQREQCARCGLLK